MDLVTDQPGTQGLGAGSGSPPQAIGHFVQLLFDTQRPLTASAFVQSICDLPSPVRAKAQLCLARALITMPPWKDVRTEDGVPRAPYRNMLDRLDCWLEAPVERTPDLVQWLDEEWAIESAEADQDWIDVDARCGPQAPYRTAEEAIRTVNWVQGLGWDLTDGICQPPVTDQQLEFIGAPALRAHFRSHLGTVLQLPPSPPST